MPTLTRKEIAANATAASSAAAMRRRFARFAEEIRRNPSMLSDFAATQLAEALHERGGWRVFEDH